VDAWKCVASGAIIGWMRDGRDVAKSVAHLKVVRVVYRAIDALACVPRKRGVARDAKHLVAPVHLGDVHTALGALFGVATELLHGRDVVIAADVPCGGLGRLLTVRRPLTVGCVVDVLVTLVARGLQATRASRGVLRHKPATLGRATRHVVFVRVGFREWSTVPVGVSDTLEQCTLLGLFCFRRNVSSAISPRQASNAARAASWSTARSMYGSVAEHCDISRLKSVASRCFLYSWDQNDLGNESWICSSLKHATRVLEATREEATVAGPAGIFLALWAFNTSTRSSVECVGADRAAQRLRVETFRHVDSNGSFVLSDPVALLNHF